VQGGMSNGDSAFATGAEMALYLKDALRYCFEGLHCRLATPPGHVNGLVDSIYYFAKSYSTKDVAFMEKLPIIGVMSIFPKLR
jgi:hypothetical protein